MSKMAELAYDIEQLYIEGCHPTKIAKLLNCPLSTIYDWLESEGLDGGTEVTPFDQWPEDAQNRLIRDLQDPAKI